MEIIKGRKLKPFNIILIGERGVGKSTFGQAAPDPIFVGCEENDEMIVDRAPVPKTFKEITKQLDDIYKLKYKTLVVDTIDSIEKLRIRELLGQKTQLNWDKQAALENDFIGFRNQLKKLRDEKKMHIMILAHSKTRIKTDTIHQADYDTTEATLRKSLMTVFGDWTSCILFASYKTEISTNVQTEKNYVIGDGERILLTEQRPGHPGKNRYGLQYEMPFLFDDFYDGYLKFYKQGDTRNIIQIIESIVGIAGSIENEKTRKTIDEQVKKHKTNKLQLLRIEERAKERAKA